MSFDDPKYIPRISSSVKVLSLSKNKIVKKQTSLMDCLSGPLKNIKEETNRDLFNKGKGKAEEFAFEKPTKVESTSELDTEIHVKQEPTDVKEDSDNDLKYDQELLQEMEHESITDMIDAETPRLESLSMSDSRKRKRVGEDVFTKECVKSWQGSRIKAWEGRYMTAEGYYFRFVTPGEGQQNGGWSAAEHKLFMDRYNEWIEKGYKIGASWGLFSCAIPHRVGYQCMNYYRKLIGDGKIKDPSYVVEGGKIKQIHKEKAPSGIVPVTELGPEWQNEEIKEIERNVDQWLKEFHGRSGNKVTSRPIVPPKAKSAAPRVLKTTTRRSNIGDLVKRMPPRISNGIDDDFISESDPEVAHLQQRDWETEWRERLDMYKKFLEPYLDKSTRHRYWQAKQEWRRSLITTEMLLQKSFVQKSNLTAIEPSTPKIQQSSLSRFFTGVKKLKVDTPDELVSFVRIPNDLYSGVKQIQSIQSKSEPEPSKTIYYEIDDMNESIKLINEVLSKDPPTEDRPHSPLEGILVDPPWEFYVADGKNDGRCSWNLSQFENLLKDIVCHMTAGMVFVWTHKMIQADVVRTMYNLDCKYVENLVWFKKSINNVHLDEPSPYISSTKEILLMFKKGDGFELRHQRSADVIIEFEKPKSEWIDDEYTEPKPPGVFDMIETLLPKAAYDESIKRGRFVELWAKKKLPRREGWIAFHENKTAKQVDAVPEISDDMMLID